MLRRVHNNVQRKRRKEEKQKLRAGDETFQILIALMVVKMASQGRKKSKNGSVRSRRVDALRSCWQLMRA
ncbi:hypothetical protein HUJ04_009084 [Dendroctonus ponderosae]|nr:hypothetical protein HUJ04_009084 [Dendroctonus ponderosae]